MKLIPDDLRKEIDLRIERLLSLMSDSGLDAMLIASNSNIYYTTGRFFRGFVYIMASGKVFWFVIKPQVYEEDDNIVYIRKPENIPSILDAWNMNMPVSIGFENDSLSYNEVVRLSKIFPNSKIMDASPVMRRARMVKTEWEIARMKEDGIHQAEVYRRVSKLYREDMTDIEFQIEIERVLRREGSLGFIRTAGNLMDINLGSVIAGDNADIPGPYDFTMGGTGADPSLPVGANGMIMKRGETVMVDMNGSFNGYQTDMTRVWKLGEIPDLAYKAHDCSIEILHKLEKEIVPGMAVSEIYEIAVEMVKKNSLENYFMGHQSQAAFIGHGVGIELNEQPVIMKKSKDLVLENMTLAIEPKFVIPHVGAVGIENTYRVIEKGLENLTVFNEEIQSL